MFPKFDFIRRFTDESSVLGQLVSFNLEIEFDLNEDEIVQELVHGYGAAAGA